MSGTHRRSSKLWEWLVPGLIGLLPLGMAVDADIAQAVPDLGGPKARHGRAGAAEATIELADA